MPLLAGAVAAVALEPECVAASAPGDAAATANTIALAAMTPATADLMYLPRCIDLS
jgi:hypothetical protein